MMTLTQYLKWQNLTQAEFAAQLGVNQGTISKLTSGKKPKWATAAQIEKATGGAVPVAVWAKDHTNPPCARQVQPAQKSEGAV